MSVFLFLYCRGNVYPHRYLDTYIDEYDVKLVRTERYSVKHEEVQESAVLYDDVAETFLVVTEDLHSTLETKYLWK